MANALNGDSKPKTTSETLTFAKAAYDYTRDSLQYNLNASSADKGALAGLREGEGTCVEYASLFVALNRAAGIPARIVNGFAHYSKVLADTSSSSRLEKQRHQWAEFYLPGQGWIPVDPTLGTATNSRFGSLSAGYYIIQNYGDLPISGSYKGGKLNISFDYSIEIDNVPSTL